MKKKQNMPDLKEGYKNSPLGLIPVEWEVKELGGLFDFKNGLNKEKEAFGKGTPIVNYVDVYSNNNIESKKLKGRVSLSSSEIKRYEVKKGDVFFTRTSETIDEIGLSSVVIDEPNDTVFSGFILRARPKNNKLALHYKKYCFSTFQARKEIIRKSTYTTRALTNGSFLSEVLLFVPPISEQVMIANLLGAWDKAIQNITQLIIQKEQRKKWLMQQLLTGKKRLKGYNEKWKINSLEKFLSPELREVEKPPKPYLALGIRSHGKGTFLKPDELPEKNSMETLYVVRKNDLIVNITFAWEMAIAIVGEKDDGALVSHRFPTYTFKENIGHPDFFRFFILQPKMKYLLDLISPGGAGRNRVLDKADFLKLEFAIPDYKEQVAIADLLLNVNKEIQLLITKAYHLQDQKRGLMQQLLTGKIKLKNKN